jgi:hypothetical protein
VQLLARQRISLENRVKKPVVLLFVQVDKRLWLEYAGIVDQQIDSAETLPCRFDYVTTRGRFSDIARMIQIGSDGCPSGLPDNGAIGALTNNPAFRDMLPVAASHARSVSSVQVADPIERLKAQKVVIAHFRAAHPEMNTKGAFRSAWRQASQARGCAQEAGQR